LAPWTHLSRDELRVLDSTFWSAGESRHRLADRLGCSKSKANALIAGLIEQGLLVEAGAQRSQGGRPAETLRLAPTLGVLLAVDVGATSLGVAVLAPDLTLLAQREEPADVRTQGPGEVLARARKLLHALLAEQGLASTRVLGIGIGVPGPVNFAIGQLVNPPLMPSWDSFSIRDFLADDFGRAPVWVDNDVNAMALGELWRLRRAWPNFLVIKVGTGIGCGIVCHGEVYRGATGSAGDVGHICVDQDGPRCHCGNVGCVEAMAAGPAIVRRAIEVAESGESPALAELLRAKGRLEAVDVGEASRAGDAAANHIVQRAGSLIGQMLASVVNFFNPSHILLGGGIVHIGPLFLASVRQSVYHRSLPLSTRHLEVQLAGLGENAGLIGAGALAMSELLKSGGEDVR
jgi:glucokinase-like ROK family protein